MTATASLLLLPPAQTGSPIDLSLWAAWLSERLVPDWRPAEWDPDLLLFTGDFANPKTSVWKCSTAACQSPIYSSIGFCITCERGKSRLPGQSRQEFIESFVPERNRRIGLRPSACRVVDGDHRCPRQHASLGLCRCHYSAWVKAQNRGVAFESWLSQAKPYEPLPDCGVRGCELDSCGPTGLCIMHGKHWRQAVASGRFGDDRDGLRRWSGTALPYLALHQFSLVASKPVVRLEILYALQERDRRGKKVDPGATRRLLGHVADAEHLAVNDPVWPDVRKLDRSRNDDAIVRDLRWSLEVALDRFRGIDPRDRSTWDLAAVELPSRATITGRRIQAGTVDFNQIRQPWLRDLALAWARETNPESVHLRSRLAACLTASRALHLRPGGGLDPAELGFADMNAVVDAFRNQRRRDGELMKSTRRSQLLAAFCEVLDYGRAAGLLTGMSANFARHSSHRILREEINEDEIGKAIPEPVIRQLDEHLHLMATGMSYGQLAPADLQAMFQTVYVVHRDTGRRPHETCGLRLDCLEFDDGEYTLVWDNLKGRRLRRRLPIMTSTAETIIEWRERRARLPIPSRSRGHLFPAAGDDTGIRHLTSSKFGTVLRSWVDSIPELHAEELDKAGEPLPFDRSLIFAYAFRHAYAQRHADAGIRVEVLKELMDHASVNTTMGYFTVSLKRKREAVNTMRLHVIDRAGRSAPARSTTAYETRSVAVPFGNCNEPTNVKAGGKACPIRFQCAGCGFYRPDPSYLPAIEDHVRALKSDRETADAMGADEFVIRNLTDQIDAFRQVVTVIQDNLQNLPDDERRAVEEASSILRKVRAADGRTALPLTVVQRNADG